MKKSWIRIALIIITVAIIGIQFIPVKRNNGDAFTHEDITKAVAVPTEVISILQTSCYDCHSDYTTYPWYTSIQPVGIWMQDHVDEGKRELNFSKFNAYNSKRKKHKLEEIAEQVEEHEMPLSSYTLAHRDAELTKEQEELLINWAKKAMDEVKPD